MRHRTVRNERYRYIRNFTPEVPLLAPSNYKETQYPVWNLLKKLNAEGKLTPAQAALCAPRMPEEELYDLHSDPHEIRNLANSDDPRHQATLKQLRRVLESWIEDTNDQGEFPDLQLFVILDATRAQSYLAGPPIVLQKPVIAAMASIGRRRGYRPRYD